MIFTYEFDWSVLGRPEYRGYLISGVGYTVLLAVTSTFTSLLLGTLLTAARLARTRWLTWPATAWVGFVRHVPGVFLMLFFYFVFPEILPESLGMALHGWDHYALLAGIIALTVDNGTYVSDILRNGVLAIPHGEREAARSCGLTPQQQWICCLLPLAVRIVLPPLANRTIHNFKNSSLCMVIGVTDLTWATQQIESLTFRGLEATFVATVFYVVLSLMLGWGAFQLERRFSAGKSSVGQVWRTSHTRVLEGVSL